MHLDTLGIFRVPGDSAAMEELKARYDKGERDIDLSKYSVHVIAGVFKLFFRRMEEPLIPHRYYSFFITANDIEKEEEKIFRIRQTIQRFTKYHRKALKVLLIFLKKVAVASEQNKMTVDNIAIVFAPNLLLPPSGSGGTLIVMSDYSPKAAAIVVFMIENVKKLFRKSSRQVRNSANKSDLLVGHTGAWHEEDRECSVLCKIQLKGCDVGKAHWACCFSIEKNGRSCSKK